MSNHHPSFELVLRLSGFDSHDAGAKFVGAQGSHWRTAQAMRAQRIQEENERMHARLTHTHPYVGPLRRTPVQMQARAAIASQKSVMAGSYLITPNSLEGARAAYLPRPASARPSSAMPTPPPKGRALSAQNRSRPASAAVHSSLPHSPYVARPPSAAAARSSTRASAFRPTSPRFQTARHVEEEKENYDEDADFDQLYELDHQQLQQPHPPARRPTQRPHSHHTMHHPRPPPTAARNGPTHSRPHSMDVPMHLQHHAAPPSSSHPHYPPHPSEHQFLEHQQHYHDPSAYAPPLAHYYHQPPTPSSYAESSYAPDALMYSRDHGRYAEEWSDQQTAGEYHDGDHPHIDSTDPPSSDVPAPVTSSPFIQVTNVRPRSAAHYQPALAMETFSNGAQRYSSRNCEFVMHASKAQQQHQYAMEAAAAHQAAAQHAANYNSHMHYTRVVPPSTRVAAPPPPAHPHPSVHPWSGLHPAGGSGLPPRAAPPARRLVIDVSESAQPAARSITLQHAGPAAQRPEAIFRAAGWSDGEVEPLPTAFTTAQPDSEADDEEATNSYAARAYGVDSTEDAPAPIPTLPRAQQAMRQSIEAQRR